MNIYAQGRQYAKMVPPVKIEFQKNYLPLKNGSIGTLILKITNISDSLHTASIEIKADSSIKIISDKRIKSLPDIGHSVYVPVLIQIADNGKANYSLEVRAILKNGNGQGQEKATALIAVEPTQQVTLSVPQSSILLDKHHPVIKFPIQLSNQGNTPQRVAALVQVPAEYGSGVWQKALVVTLSAFSDTTLYFYEKAPKNLLEKDLQTITVRGLYNNNVSFGMATVSVSAATSERKFRNPDIQEREKYAASGNLTLSAQYLFTDMEDYRLRANGKALLPDADLNYNVDITWYKNRNINPLLARNTYLTYKRNRWGATVGNIYRNGELYVSGVGASAFVQDSSGKNKIEVGRVKGQYNLFYAFKEDEILQPPISKWASWQHNGGDFWWKTSFLRQENPLYGRVSDIWSNEIRHQINPHNEITATVNMGKSSDTADSRNGLGLGLKYVGSHRDFSWFSDNFISTSRYPGIRRGAFTMNEKLTRTIGGGKSVWGSFNAYSYTPKALPGPKENFLSRYSNTEAGMGMSFQLRNISLSFQPNWKQQKSNLSALTGSHIPARLESWNLNVFGSFYDFTSGQQFSFNSSTGIISHPRMPGISDFHYQMALNYNYRHFSLSTSYQSGYFYLGEIIPNPKSNQQPFKNYHYFMVTPQYSGRIWRNRLAFEVNGSLMKRTGSGLSTMFHIGLQYILGPRSKVSAGFTRYAYDKNAQALNNTEMSFSSALRTADLRRLKRNNMDIFLYKDFNHNGQYDWGDSAASETLVYINDIPFVTNSKGHVIYKSLPEGNYTLRVPTSGGWYVPRREIEINNTRWIRIPMQQSGQLTGKIVYKNNTQGFGFAPEKITMNNLQILAQSKEGEKYYGQIYPSGNFEFFLPKGTYTIILNVPFSGLECSNNNRVVRMTYSHQETINFIVESKQNSLDMKSFTDISMTED